MNPFFGDTESSEIHRGMIGWEDEDEWYFLGEGSNDGYTLLRVQLYTNRNPGTEHNPDRAQGTKLICHMSSGLFRIPAKDTPCYVAIPKGMEDVLAAGVVFATVEKSPSTQFAENRAVMDFGDDTHVIIKGKSISLQDPDNRFIAVGTPLVGGTPGLTFQAADGTGGTIQEGALGWFVADGGATKTLIQMTPDAIECFCTAGGMWKVDANFYTLGTTCTVAGGAVYLGKTPTAATPVLWGLTGIAGVASPSVFVSLV